MQTILRSSLSLGVAALALAVAPHSAAAGGDPLAYVETKLVADQPGIALATDPALVNPWGIAFAPGGAFWINDNGTGLSTLYTGAPHVIPAQFVVPTPTGAGTSAPTGEVFNASSAFVVPGTTAPAIFIFATEDGTISAWNPTVPTFNKAVLTVDNSGTQAVYKGLAIGQTAAGNFLYATNFRSGQVDVFDKNFAPVTISGGFTDPTLPAGYAPFGIANIDGDLFVSFAKQDSAKHDNLDGRGKGYVDVFDTSGHFLQRFAGSGHLNAPWAIVRAPIGFGAHSGEILIGNFGDGLINGYNMNGTWRGALLDAGHSPIAIDGLWGLSFGGAAVADSLTLYFTAGTNGESHGLFGSIRAAASPAD